MTEFFSQCSAETWCRIGVGLVALVCYIGVMIGIGRFASTNRTAGDE